MAKKKKSQLKPVARGFATQSMPKKVTEVQVVEEQAEHASSASVSNSVDATVLQSSNSQKEAAEQKITSDGFDPAKVEEQSLQDLVDRYQERTEREVVRTVKVKCSMLKCGRRCSLLQDYRTRTPLLRDPPVHRI